MPDGSYERFDALKSVDTAVGLYPRPNVIYIAHLIGIVCIYIGHSGISPFLPNLLGNAEVAPFWTGLIFCSYPLAQAVVSFKSSGIIQKYGAEWTHFFSLTLVLTGHFFFSLCPLQNPLLLIIARCIAGGGSALTINAGYVLTSRLFLSNLNMRVAIIEVFIGMATAFGDIGGGYLYEEYGWKTTFTTLICLFIFACCCSFICFRSVPRPSWNGFPQLPNSANHQNSSLGGANPVSMSELLFTSPSCFSVFLIGLTASAAYTFYDPVLAPHLESSFGPVTESTVGMVLAFVSVVYTIATLLAGAVLEDNEGDEEDDPAVQGEGLLAVGDELRGEAERLLMEMEQQQQSQFYQILNNNNNYNVNNNLQNMPNQQQPTSFAPINNQAPPQNPSNFPAANDTFNPPQPLVRTLSQVVSTLTPPISQPPPLAVSHSLAGASVTAHPPTILNSMSGVNPSNYSDTNPNNSSSNNPTIHANLLKSNATGGSVEPFSPITPFKNVFSGQSNNNNSSHFLVTNPIQSNTPDPGTPNNVKPSSALSSPLKKPFSAANLVLPTDQSIMSPSPPAPPALPFLPSRPFVFPISALFGLLLCAIGFQTVGPVERHLPSALINALGGVGNHSEGGWIITLLGCALTASGNAIAFVPTVSWMQIVALRAFVGRQSQEVAVGAIVGAMALGEAFAPVISSALVDKYGFAEAANLYSIPFLLAAFLPVIDMIWHGHEINVDPETVAQAANNNANVLQQLLVASAAECREGSRLPSHINKHILRSASKIRSSVSRHGLLSSMRTRGAAGSIGGFQSHQPMYAGSIGGNRAPSTSRFNIPPPPISRANSANPMSAQVLAACQNPNMSLEHIFLLNSAVANSVSLTEEQKEKMELALTLNAVASQAALEGRRLANLPQHERVRRLLDRKMVRGGALMSGRAVQGMSTHSNDVRYIPSSINQYQQYSQQPHQQYLPFNNNPSYHNPNNANNFMYNNNNNIPLSKSQQTQQQQQQQQQAQYNNPYYMGGTYSAVGQQQPFGNTYQQGQFFPTMNIGSNGGSNLAQYYQIQYSNDWNATHSHGGFYF